jgi:hypothetical protein
MCASPGGSVFVRRGACDDTALGPGKAVPALLDEIADPGGPNAPASARAVKLLLSKMFDFALPRECSVDFNPVLGTQARKPRSRERLAVDPEIVLLVGALDAESLNSHHLIAHWFLLTRGRRFVRILSP